MPSFTFWKSSKTDEAKSPLLNDDGKRQGADQVIQIAGKLDLDPGNEDAGVFVSEQPESQMELSEISTLLQQDAISRSTLSPTVTSVGDVDAKLLDGDQIRLECQLLHACSATSLVVDETGQNSSAMSHKTPATLLEEPSKPGSEATPQDRDSGVYLAEDSEQLSSSQPASVAASPVPTPPRTSTLALRESSSSTTQHKEAPARRLHRPTELNLSKTDSDSSKPRSELEKRFDLMRNSKTQSRAALRSPTELLKERLNMSPKKSAPEEKIRVFVPPKPSRTGCLLSGPAGRTDAFTSTSVRARTEVGGRPAWWCKFDNLVVFDGIEKHGEGEPWIHTRTSKGLSIARQRGDTETVVIPMNCAHCQDMLKRHEWKYDIQVCKRSVCWECRERCKWEYEQERTTRAKSCASRAETNRDRADSVLQDTEVREDELVRKIGIEQGRPKSPMEVVGGIEERLDRMTACGK
ncbi:hypothetical protein EK21DRAFT_88514 [Setomelanomma holmii]|uniref:Uncharacterized protein n=1 Tax=Setomelanomma holmii TaxID=210430 RepID=A0A9P4LMK3_9PLEO|nr:hypothetical protein EK21DRAFT_88514 [Setomelanomma holmii]